MRSVRLLNGLDRNRLVRAVPFQKRGVLASVGLTLEDPEGQQDSMLVGCGSALIPQAASGAPG
jgi:hypothetical protein